MASYLDKLNLRPQERRLVVGIVAVIFVVLNVWLVWPRFGDWKRMKADLAKTYKNISDYNKKIAQAGGPKGFQAELQKLEGEGAQSVVEDEQEIQLLRTVQSHIQESKVMVNRYGGVIVSSSTGSTNEFFEEQSITLEINTGEKELVDFLLKIGEGGSMIRVRDLDLRPADQNRYKLQGRVTLSANYQKKAAAKPGTPAVKSGKPALKPPPSSSKKT
jgi:hypothetical protein